jgi:DNA polymerase III subunit epsilon
VKKYAIIDIETTGGRADNERITEIAIVLHDGNKTIDTYTTLINPERAIPYFITNITGIDDRMVRDAPKFFEVAKKIVEMTEGAIFVAHNVQFDYGFVQEEFKRLGYTYSRKQLCTVRLSRKAFPGLASYALGNLIKHFKIKVKDRHRALADTLATTQIFDMILKQGTLFETVDEMVNKGIKESNLPKTISIERLHQLPTACGVYYLHDEKGAVIYVGKSINIQKRMFEHFNDKTEKGVKLRKGVHDFSYELTGSELVALLLESAEIKRIQPTINKAQRAVHFPYCIFSFKDEQGYTRFHAVKNMATLRKKNNVLVEFQKLQDAKGYLKGMVTRFDLCANLMDPNSVGRCFNYQLKQCKGACLASAGDADNAESPDTYNARAQAAIEKIRVIFEEDFFIIDVGRTKDEQAVVLIRDGHYRGFGYIDATEALTTEDLWESIKEYPVNADVDRIVRQFMTDKRVKIVKL